MTSEATIIFLSLRIAALAMLIAIPSGMILAWLLARKEFRGKFLLDTLVSLPLAVPPVVVGYFLLWSIGGNSWIGKAWESLFGGNLAFTWLAASLAAAVVALPLIVRSFAAALQGVDPQLETAARVLGAGPWRTFLTITLPLAYRGVLAGVLLGFVRALSEFGATIVVAGNIPGSTQGIPSAIFTRLSTGDTGTAWRLAFVSIAIGVAALLVHNYLLNRARESNTKSSENTR